MPLNKNRKPQFNDVPPVTAICLIVTLIGLIVALSVKAPTQVTLPLTALVAALGLNLKRP